MRTITFIALLSAALVSAGCGDTSSGRSPSKVVITEVKVGAGGQSPTLTVGPLNSDVRTNGGIFDDLAQFTMELVLKDPGVPGTTATPSDLNAVSFSRYHVEYRRADGRNTQGVDVPFAFDGGSTFTIGTQSTSTIVEVVRHEAKLEAPLRALINDQLNVINTIATVTFYGKDQAGNNVVVKADITVNFSDFADPT